MGDQESPLRRKRKGLKVVVVQSRARFQKVCSSSHICLNSPLSIHPKKKELSIAYPYWKPVTKIFLSFPFILISIHSNFHLEITFHLYQIHNLSMLLPKLYGKGQFCKYIHATVTLWGFICCLTLWFLMCLIYFVMLAEI